MAVTDALGEQPAEAGSTSRDHGVHPDDRCGVACGDGRTGIEAEPAEPQQTGSQHDQGQVVWAHRIVLPAEPLAKDDGESKTGNTGVDVNSCAACEVDRREIVGDPASDVGVKAEVEYPVGDGEVDQCRPDPREDQPGGEL